jgi:rare lipoprotein A
MVRYLGGFRTSGLTGSSRSLFTVAVVLVLSAVARDTLPADALPFIPRAMQQPVPAAEVLAPVTGGGQVTTLKRIKSGLASWYGKVLQNHPTASGRRFNMYEMTAAHRDLPFGSRVRVTDLRNHRSVVVTVTDRGVLDADRVIDLSYGAAKQLQMLRSGVDPVSLELLTARNIPLAVR